MRSKTRLLTAWLILPFGIALLTASCGNRTVYVKAGDPVRLRQTIKNAEIWAANDKGEWSPGEMDLPEGWYALPDPGQKEVPKVAPQATTVSFKSLEQLILDDLKGAK